MHELLVDPEWRLPANENAFSANAAPGVDADALGARVREAMTRAFWDATRDALLEKDVRRAAGLVAELGDALASLCPENRRSEAEAALLLRLTPTAAAAALARVADDPGALGDAFAEVTRDASRMLARLGAPARDARAARDAEALERRVGARSPPRRRLFLPAETRSARCASPRTPSRTRCASSSPRSRLSAGTSRTSRSRVWRRWRAATSGASPRDRRGPGTGSRRGAASPKRWPEAAAGGGDATRLAAALPRTSAWLAAATRAAHALDASIPSLAFETRDVAFRVPPNATSATSAGATNPRRFAFAMRSGNAFGSARGKDARSGAFRIASSSPRDPAQVSVRATRATSHEGLVRVALVNLVTSSDKSVEAPDGGGSAETPETLEFDAARLRDARRAFRRAPRPRRVPLRRGRRAVRRAAPRTRSARGAPRAPGRLARRPDDIRGRPRARGGGRRRRRAQSRRRRRDAASAARAARSLRRAADARARGGSLRARASRPPVAAASTVAAARAAAGAAPLLRAGFRGPDGAAVARDVASLAASLDVSVGRVTWGVHARARTPFSPTARSRRGMKSESLP